MTYYENKMKYNIELQMKGHKKTYGLFDCYFVKQL